MNTYSPDNSAILDATGKPWPVETPHPLPLPAGVEQDEQPNGTALSILYAGPARLWYGTKIVGATHWLARRPLPPVPKVKTQEELDEEFIESTSLRLAAHPTTSYMEDMKEAMLDAIAYARKPVGKDSE